MRCAALMTLLFGCTATETGNPLGPEENMIAQAFSSRPELAAIKSESEITIEELWINAGEVRLEPCEGDRTEIAGPIALDLVAGDVLDFGGSDLCRLRVDFEPLEEGAGPDELEGFSLYARGQAGPVRFEIQSTSDQRIERRSETPFSLDDAEHMIMLAFDVGVWLEDVDIAGARKGTSTRVDVNEEENPELLELIEEKLSEAIDLYEDRDGDSEPSSSDRITG